MDKRMSSSYIENENIVNTNMVKAKKSPYGVIISASIAFVALIIALQPVFSSIININNSSSNITQNSSTLAEAGSPAWFCSDEFGRGMDSKSGWEDSLGIQVYPEKGSRELTLQEALGKGISFVSYAGEGEAKEKDFTRPKETPKPPKTVLAGSETKFDEAFKKNKGKLEAERYAWSCISAIFVPSTASFILTTASTVTKIAQFTAVMVFNGNLVCPEPGEGGMCLDLLGIIGGTGGEGEGIVGVLTSSIYYPLLVIAVAITGLWVLKRGIIDRKVREALFGAIWLCVSVILGLALLLNPLLITKAPIAINNVVTSCVIGAFNGNNCFDSGSGNSIEYEDGESTSEKVCRSSSDQANIDEQMTFTTSSITCSIWKAFILEPYAQGTFGTSFNNLDVKSNPELNKLLKDEKLEPNMFCVNLGTKKSLEEQSGKYLQLDSKKNKVCNLLAYQMYLKTKATTTGDQNVTDVDYKWYRVIMAAVADDGLWGNWTNDIATGFNKLSVSFIALFASGLGTFIIFITSLFALVYYLSAVILMAFAPLFFLLAVHPGRGKSMFMGWLEKVISNVLKYLASAVFLIVTISIYGGILANIDNIGLTLLFIIIITMALFMYRSELIDLLGRANMGGEKLSSRLTDRMRDSGKSALKFAGSTAVAGAGGVAGAALTSDGVKPVNPFKKGGMKELIKNNAELGRDMSAGFKDGIKRETKRNPGFIGNVARQYDRNTVDNKQDLRAKMDNAAKDKEQSQENLADKQKAFEDAQTAQFNAEQQKEIDKGDLKGLKNEHENVKAAEERSLDEFKKRADYDYARKVQEARDKNLTNDELKVEIKKLDNAKQQADDFSELQKLLNSIRDTKMELAIADRTGNTEKAQELAIKIKRDEDQAGVYRSRISDRRMENFTDRYEKPLERDRNLGIIKDFDKEMQDSLVKKEVDYINQRENFTRLNNDMRAKEQELNKAKEAMKIADKMHEEYEETYIGMRPGEGMTDKKVKRIERRIQNESDAIKDRTNSENSRIQREIDGYVAPETEKIVGDKPISSDRANYHDVNDVEIMDKVGGPTRIIPDKPSNPPTVGIPDKPSTPPTVGVPDKPANKPDVHRMPPKPKENPTVHEEASTRPNTVTSRPAVKQQRTGGGENIGRVESRVNADETYAKSRRDQEKQLKKNEENYIAERKRKIEKEKGKGGNNSKRGSIRDTAKQREEMMKNDQNKRNGGETRPGSPFKK